MLPQKNGDVSPTDARPVSASNEHNAVQDDDGGGGGGDEEEERSRFLDNGEPNGIGYWGAVAHMIRATVGTGILLLPFEMRNLGYVTGTALLLAVSCVYYHIIHILLYLDSRLRRRLKVQRLTYALIADEIFAKSPFPANKCRLGLLFVIYVYYIVPTSKSISLVVIAKNIQQMARYFHVELHFTLVVSLVALALAAFCVCGGSILKILVPFSSATNIFTFVIAATIVVYSTVYRRPAATDTVRPFGDTSFVLRGTAIFVNAVLSTDIMLPLKNGMREPQRLAGIFGAVNLTAFIITIFYYAFALIPYLNYGDAVQENILSNIPVNDLLILGMNLVYSLALSVSYILSFYACFDVVWTSKLQRQLTGSGYEYVVEYAIRIGFTALAYFLAVAVSHLALISAIGGILGIFLDVSLMPLLQIMLMRILGEKNYYVIFKNILLICASMALFFMSIVDCVGEVKKLYVIDKVFLNNTAAT